MDQRSDTIEVRSSFSAGWKARSFIVAAVLVGLGLLVYRDTIVSLFVSVLQREDSSHGLFVPFISGYLIWLKRHRIKGSEVRFSLFPGLAMVAAGFLIFYLSRESLAVALPALSFLLAASGVLIALLGAPLFKELMFPVFYLTTMIPLPKLMYLHIAEWMRAATIAGSVWLTQLMNIPIYREGLSIYLPNINLSIVIGCSGIRYLLSYFVFSLAYGYLCKKSLRSRALVVLSSLPIALSAGVLRLFSTYLATYYIGPSMMEPRPHYMVSWSVFGLVLIAAIGLDQYLSRDRDRGSGAREQGD